MNFIKSISNFLFSYGTGNVPPLAPDFQAIIRSYVPDEPEESLRVIWSRINDDLERYFKDNPGALEELIATANEGGIPAEYKEVALALKEAKERGVSGGSLIALAYAVSDAVDDAVYEASIEWRGFGTYFSVKGAIVNEGVLESM